MTAGERVRLGRTDLRVTRLGLGLAPIGGLFTAVPDAQALATVDRAWDRGLRLYDTAPLYGYGRSEQLAGRALSPRPHGDGGLPGLSRSASSVTSSSHAPASR
ncbi:hypothetical protein Lfu02_65380 [Longispora fulva]|uniref:Aryl-alcohol dehydrogenase-like predicted oxidoreductase n=1 Tax=Longispora fulva TaxID=619741 RepID=A0A8J7GJA8_9ACTN|nr:aldo/keto reductase [Longispora fulva]MBG6137675.1 aryl-alcohol dehydrogenase-like predicted oxidoreductase [Longispora fulva]GIG62166.1 hypothetical protein Lfu02_65380 [Longispora fulva]